jgi:hypothetical protein
MTTYQRLMTEAKEEFEKAMTDSRKVSVSNLLAAVLPVEKNVRIRPTSDDVTAPLNFR